MNIVRNISINVISQCLSMIYALTITPYTARTLGAGGVGVYSYTLSIVNCFALFILLGLGNYGCKEIARVRDCLSSLSKKFEALFCIQFCCAFIVILFYTIYIYNAEIYQIELIIQLVFLLYVASDVTWYLTGTMQFRLAMYVGLVVKVGQILLIVIFIKSKEDLLLYIFIMNVMPLLGNAYIWKIVSSQIRYEKIKIHYIVENLKPNIILFIPILATSIFVVVDKIMLFYIGKEIADVGFYDYSEKLVKLPLSIVSAIGVVMLSVTSNVIAKNTEISLHEYFYKTMKYEGIIVIACAFGVAAIAPTFCIVFYGDGFDKCIHLVEVMSVIIATSALANIIRTQILIPMNKNNIYIYAVVIAAVSNVILNYVLIPEYSVMGAALATVVAEISLTIVHIMGVKREYKLFNCLVYWFIYALGGGIMFVSMRWIMNCLGVNAYSLVCQIIAGGLIYIIFSSLILIIDKDYFATKVVEFVLKK